MASEIFITIIAFLGFVAGAILKSAVPEEQKPGKKYMVIAGKVILAVLAVYIIITFLSTDLTGILFFIIGLLVGTYFRRPYFYLGLAMLNFNFIITVLVFSFGIIYGNKRIISNAILFSIPFLVLLTPLNTTYPILFAGGGLLGMLSFSKTMK
jgi:hypothetical protein